MLLVRESAPRPPALEVAVAHALVEHVNEGVLDSLVRVYRPAPTVAFGRLDALRPGFGAAVAAARRLGFEPVLRAPGGHAVAYHDGCLGIDELRGEQDPIAGMHDRFALSGSLLAGALRELGVDARVGRVPGEFCPGEFTVNARGAVKLVGTAQRVLRHASLLRRRWRFVMPMRCGRCWWTSMRRWSSSGIRGRWVPWGWRLRGWAWMRWSGRWLRPTALCVRGAAGWCDALVGSGA